MWLFLLFVSIPLIEIALFIQLGGLIGLWPTLAIVVLTAILGTWLIRQQGTLALAQVRRSFSELRDPAEPLAHGAMIIFAGALLMAPGFFTDTLGLALLLPPVRAAAWRWLSRRMVVQTVGFSTPPRRGPGEVGDVIEGEFEEITPRTRRPDAPSGWTRD